MIWETLKCKGNKTTTWWCRPLVKCIGTRRRREWYLSIRAADVPISWGGNSWRKGVVVGGRKEGKGRRKEARSRLLSPEHLRGWRVRPRLRPVRSCRFYSLGSGRLVGSCDTLRGRSLLRWSALLTFRCGRLMTRPFFNGFNFDSVQQVNEIHQLTFNPDLIRNSFVKKSKGQVRSVTYVIKSTSLANVSGLLWHSKRFYCAHSFRTMWDGILRPRVP